MIEASNTHELLNPIDQKNTSLARSYQPVQLTVTYKENPRTTYGKVSPNARCGKSIPPLPNQISKIMYWKSKKVSDWAIITGGKSIPNNRLTQEQRSQKTSTADHVQIIPRVYELAKVSPHLMPGEYAHINSVTKIYFCYSPINPSMPTITIANPSLVKLSCKNQSFNIYSLLRIFLHPQILHLIHPKNLIKQAIGWAVYHKSISHAYWKMPKIPIEIPKISLSTFPKVPTDLVWDHQ